MSLEWVVIIHGLNPSYRGFIIEVSGWSTQPSLVVLENLFVDQEALTKQMSDVFLKSNDDAFFISQRRDRCNWRPHGGSKGGGFKRGDSQVRRDESNCDRRGQHFQEYSKDDGPCFVCGKKSHYTIDCRFKKRSCW